MNDSLERNALKLDYHKHIFNLSNDQPASIPTEKAVTEIQKIEKKCRRSSYA